MFRFVKRVLIVSTVMVALAGLVACELEGDDNGAGGGGLSSRYLGESFTLPSGTIVDWGLDFSGSADLYVDLDGTILVYDPVTVDEDGHFPGMLITAPDLSHLSAVTEFSDDIPWLTVSNPDAYGASFYGLEVRQDGSWVGDVYRESSDGRIEVEWWYVDEDVRIWGEGTIEDEDFSINADIDLQLRAGWNQVISRYNSGFSAITVRVDGEPSGVRWEYF